jgi:hypothetical protein
LTPNRRKPAVQFVDGVNEVRARVLCFPFQLGKRLAFGSLFIFCPCSFASRSEIRLVRSRHGRLPG